jgi:4-diphosphocytidyl-2-C-methyl-D-erythritol kinase
MDTNVNLLEAARDAQWSAQAFMGPRVIKIVSPAKVNLLLSIGGVRADGYHEVDTIMHALALHDSLYMLVEPLSPAALEEKQALASTRDDVAIGGPAHTLVVQIEVQNRTESPLHIPAERNLVFKAVDQLATSLNVTEPHFIHICIEKHIPAEGGLGGGSSNAAATLVGLQHAWELAKNNELVHEVACALGADVAFFLHGGCERLSGVGEVHEQALTPSKQAVVMVKPSSGVSTADAYARFDENPTPVPAEVLSFDLAAHDASDVKLANNLEPAAFELLPELETIRTWLSHACGTENVLLCGSGSTTFALCENFAQASTLAASAKAQGWWARPTSLSSLKAALIPQK